MEGEDSILDSIYDDNFEDGEDAEMLDVEHKSQNGSVQGSGGANQEHQSKGSKNKRQKRINKRNNSGGPWTNVFGIDRFVRETCRNLREQKSYMVYTAVGCLVAAALSDLIKEVVAYCGINIIKAREPKAYKEIMKKARESAKQFKQPYNRQPPTYQSKEEPSQVIATSSEDGTPPKFSNDLQHDLKCRLKTISQIPQVGMFSVHDRLRVPVSYDDDLLVGEPKDDAI